MTTPDVEGVRWAVAACKLWVAQDEMPVRHELLTALRWVLENGRHECAPDGSRKLFPACDGCETWREYCDAAGVSDDDA